MAKSFQAINNADEQFIFSLCNDDKSRAHIIANHHGEIMDQILLNKTEVGELIEVLKDIKKEMKNG